MGEVYEAFDDRLRRRVAVKMLRTDDYTVETSARLLREAEVLAELNHPNIVKILELGSHVGEPFIVLEYVAGGTLAAWLKGRPQPPRDAALLAAVVARGIESAHERGIIHRDLKPANVLLETDRDLTPGEKAAPLRLRDCFPKISDFGLAKWRQWAESLTLTGHVMGTPSYMAPEQASTAAEVGPAADVYALGAVLYEMVTGRPPFRGEDAVQTLWLVTQTEAVAPRVLQPGVPRDLETICCKCLEKNPAARYAGAAFLAADLEAFLAGRPIAARPVGWIGHGTRWSKRHPAAAAFASLATLALAGSALGGIAFAAVEAELRRQAEKLREKAETETKRALAEKKRADDMLTRSIYMLGEVCRRIDEPAADGVVTLRREAYDAHLTLCLDYVNRLPTDEEWSYENLYNAVRTGYLYMRLDRRDEAAGYFRKLRPYAENM
ncbi:MAG: serine/threonine-protein kinase, partial [Planctomycetia bacterium]